MDDILRVSIVSQVEHHLYFPESFLCTLCMNVILSYIADLKAATRLGIDLKIFRMNSLGIPQDRIARRLGQTRETVRDHLAKMAVLPNPPNADLSRGFTVPQVAEKHQWKEPMVWSVALESKDDLERFKAYYF